MREGRERGAEMGKGKEDRKKRGLCERKGEGGREGGEEDGKRRGLC